MNKIDLLNFKPVNGYRLVKINKKSKTTESGIVLRTYDQVVNDRSTSGVVVAESEDAEPKLLGKTVYYTVVDGEDIDEDHIILKHHSILGYTD